MYDAIVIGAGPAGITAGIYMKRANLNVLVLYSTDGNLLKTHKIDNYYGFAGGISGKKLYEDGIKQAEMLEIEVNKEEVLAIQNFSSYFEVKTEKNTYEAKAVIIATGNTKIAPNIEGIKEFEGRGVSYCAICDAFFYRNKKVAVIGSGKFALNEANELSNVVGTLILLTNGEEALNSKYEKNIKKIKKIIGDSKVREIEFEDGTKEDVDGIFIAEGEASASDFAKTLGIAENGDNIKVDEKMATNIKGIYACGNITGGLYQVSKAVYT